MIWGGQQHFRTSPRSWGPPSSMGGVTTPSVWGGPPTLPPSASLWGGPSTLGAQPQTQPSPNFGVPPPFTFSSSAFTSHSWRCRRLRYGFSSSASKFASPAPENGEKKGGLGFSGAFGGEAQGSGGSPLTWHQEAAEPPSVSHPQHVLQGAEAKGVWGLGGAVTQEGAGGPLPHSPEHLGGEKR